MISIGDRTAVGSTEIAVLCIEKAIFVIFDNGKGEYQRSRFNGVNVEFGGGVIITHR